MDAFWFVSEKKNGAKQNGKEPHFRQNERLQGERLSRSPSAGTPGIWLPVLRAATVPEPVPAFRTSPGMVPLRKAGDSVAVFMFGSRVPVFLLIATVT